MDGCMEAYRAQREAEEYTDVRRTLTEIRKEFPGCLIEVKHGHVLVWRNMEVRNETFLWALFIQDGRHWVRIRRL